MHSGDFGENSDVISMLSEEIRVILVKSDALEFHLVGIHLCNALDALEQITCRIGQRVEPG